MMNRYQDIKETKTSTGVRYMETVRFPKIPLSSNDIYVITVDGDRYDLLAQQYYSDSTLYWIILRANPAAPSNTLIPEPGTQLRIPADYVGILSEYQYINSRK